MMNSKFLTPSSPPRLTALSDSEEFSLEDATGVVARDAECSASTLGEETLVIDDRSSLSPAQMVETKLSRMLRETSLPVSHLQMRGLLRRR